MVQVYNMLFGNFIIVLDPVFVCASNTHMSFLFDCGVGMSKFSIQSIHPSQKVSIDELAKPHVKISMP